MPLLMAVVIRLGLDFTKAGKSTSFRCSLAGPFHAHFLAFTLSLYPLPLFAAAPSLPTQNRPSGRAGGLCGLVWKAQPLAGVLQCPRSRHLPGLALGRDRRLWRHRFPRVVPGHNHEHQW